MTVTLNNEQLILRGKQESFASAECILGHDIEFGEMDDRAFLRHMCPKMMDDEMQCGATLNIIYYTSRVVIPKAPSKITTTPPDFTEQASKLVESCFTSNEVTGGCGYNGSELKQKVASFAGEAATQGQVALFEQLEQIVEKHMAPNGVAGAIRTEIRALKSSVLGGSEK